MDIGQFQQDEATESEDTESDDSLDAYDSLGSDGVATHGRFYPQQILRSPPWPDEDVLPLLIQRRNSFSDDDDEVGDNTTSTSLAHQFPTNYDQPVSATLNPHQTMVESWKQISTRTPHQGPPTLSNKKADTEEPSQKGPQRLRQQSLGVIDPDTNKAYGDLM
jgi:hypothetical protein